MYIYKSLGSIIILQLITYDLQLMTTKKLSNANSFQIHDVIIHLRAPLTTDIWNNNQKASIWKEQLRHLQNLPWQITEKKLLSDFLKESYFSFDNSNLIKESFITEINKLISIYGSSSYFGEKINKTAEIASSITFIIF